MGGGGGGLHNKVMDSDKYGDRISGSPGETLGYWKNPVLKIANERHSH